MEHSVSAEGGGRNVAWGVAYRWGLDAHDLTFNRVTLFKHNDAHVAMLALHTMPNLGTAFLYRLYVVEQ